MFIMFSGHDQWRVYDYIVRHFLATLSEDCTFLHTEIIFKIGEEVFTCTGNAPLKPGFTTVQPFSIVPFIYCFQNVFLTVMASFVKIQQFCSLQPIM